MRVVSGEFGGRKLATPKTTGTRPMTDKVRAALFDILGSVEGLTVLDAYAGSGALGLESLSRGAKSVVGVEVGREAVTAIKQSVSDLGVSNRYKLEPIRVEAWLNQNEAATYDLIFAMPPYALLNRELIGRLGQRLKAQGLMVVEFPRQVTSYEIDALDLVAQRSYGDPTLVFYRRSQD